MMKAIAGKHWPVYSTLCMYWVTMIILVILSINLNRGHMVYALDDAYIHMSIAKNAVLHQVWGVTRNEFTSSTSSPLWTFLVTMTYWGFGVNDRSPLILNLLFGTAAILIAYLFLTKYVNSRMRTFIILLAAVYVTPLPSLTLVGMEHVLHVALSLCFVYLAVFTLSTTSESLPRHALLLFFVAPLMTTTRYEGFFLIFLVCSLLLIQRRWLIAVTLGMVCLLPAIFYGVWSMAHGWYFLPNPVLLKGHLPSLSLMGIVHFIASSADSILANAYILIMLIASLSFLLLYFLKRERCSVDMKYANLILTGSLFFHMVFASTVGFYRYEAYLVLLGIVVLSVTTDQWLPGKFEWKPTKKAFSYYAVLVILLVVIATPFIARALRSLGEAPRATNNIYEQQYQMGTFIKRYYQGKTVAVNDIGAVTYLADIQLVDLWGLGTLEPAELRLRKQFTTHQLSRMASQRGVTIAIVYENWFSGFSELPQHWLKAGEWTIPNNVVCGGPAVSLFAVDSSARGELTQNLRQFAADLPSDVNQNVENIRK